MVYLRKLLWQKNLRLYLGDGTKGFLFGELLKQKILSVDLGGGTKGFLLGGPNC